MPGWISLQSFIETFLAYEGSRWSVLRIAVEDRGALQELLGLLNMGETVRDFGLNQLVGGLMKAPANRASAVGSADDFFLSYMTALTQGATTVTGKPIAVTLLKGITTLSCPPVTQHRRVPELPCGDATSSPISSTSSM